MNSPGCGVRSVSPTGARHNVAESGLSTTRLRTRYGTADMEEWDPIGTASGAARVVPSGIVGHLVHLCGDVDPGRTPRDASSAADATRHAELVVPGAQFVSQPLPVARC